MFWQCSFDTGTGTDLSLFSLFTSSFGFHAKFESYCPDLSSILNQEVQEGRLEVVWLYHTALTEKEDALQKSVEMITWS